MWCDKCNSGPDPKTGRCRCAAQPQPGDKVRVTVRNVWESVVSEHGNYTAKGWVETEGADVTLEIVERADDPSLDPVGTVAELYDGSVVVKVGDGANDAWVVVGSGELLHAPSSVHGRRVTGAVPGTPAAEGRIVLNVCEECETTGRNCAAHRTGCPCGHNCNYNQDEDRCSDSCRCDTPKNSRLEVVGP